MAQIDTPFVLSEADLTTLDQLVSKGKESVRKLNRIRALQFSHQEQQPDQISKLLSINVVTVYNLRKRYREAGLERTINEKA